MTAVCSTLPPPLTTYEYGAQPVLLATIVDPETGAPVSPTTVVVKVRPPDGTVVTYTSLSSPAVTNPAIGTFRIVLPAVTQAGDWYYRFESSGSVVDANESRFFVDGSALTAPSAPTTGRWISATELNTDTRVADVQLPSGVTLDDCVVAATDLLSRWGRRYKITTETIRPLAAHSYCSLGCSCACTEVLLPPNSVVSAVVADGVTLAASAYKLYDGSRLVRQDGRYWTCQSLSTPLGQPGTWSVAVSHGNLPPKIAQMACRELSILIAQSFSNKPGRAPNKAQSVSRGGITVPIARRRMNDGRYSTGVPLVDDFVNAVNPNGLTGRPRIVSPDLPTSARG